jgi:hypothetical protein
VSWAIIGYHSLVGSPKAATVYALSWASAMESRAAPASTVIAPSIVRLR